MTVNYGGTFSVDFTINNTIYNTWSTWHLIPEKKPVVVPPTKGKDGIVTPGENSWGFILTDNYGETYETYTNSTGDILSTLNGVDCTVTLHYSFKDNTKTMAYKAHVEVSNFSTDDNYSLVTLKVTLITTADDTANDSVILSKYSCSFVIGNTTYNTHTHWHSKCTEVPMVEPPTPRTNYVEVPGRHGAVDLSEVLGDKVIYNDCEGSWTFEIEDDYVAQAYTIFKTMASTLNGKRCRVIVPNSATPTSEYIGRFTVKSLSVEAERASFTIDYRIDPWGVS